MVFRVYFFAYNISVATIWLLHQYSCLYLNYKLNVKTRNTVKTQKLSVLTQGFLIDIYSKWKQGGKSVTSIQPAFECITFLLYPQISGIQGHISMMRIGKILWLLMKDTCLGGNCISLLQKKLDERHVHLSVKDKVWL